MFLSVLQSTLTSKIAAIEEHRDSLVQQVKRVTNKLLFTLKGSAASDRVGLEMSLETAQRRLSDLDVICVEVDDILIQAVKDQTDVNVRYCNEH